MGKSTDPIESSRRGKPGRAGRETQDAEATPPRESRVGEKDGDLSVKSTCSRESPKASQSGGKSGEGWLGSHLKTPQVINSLQSGQTLYQAGTIDMRREKVLTLSLDA